MALRTHMDVDAPVSELLVHWIAEQQQRDGLCLPTVGMRPPCTPCWKREACPSSFRHCP